MGAEREPDLRQRLLKRKAALEDEISRLNGELLRTNKQLDAISRQRRKKRSPGYYEGIIREAILSFGDDRGATASEIFKYLVPRNDVGYGTIRSYLSKSEKFRRSEISKRWKVVN